MNKTCHFTRALSAFLDGELTPAEASKVRDHLDHCPVCAQTLSELAALDQGIGDIPEIDPSPDFGRRLWAVIDASHRPSRLKRLSELFWGWKPAAATAIGLCLILAAWLLAGDDRTDVRIGPSEIVIADHLDLLENYEIIRNMEMLENWDAVTDDNGQG